MYKALQGFLPPLNCILTSSWLFSQACKNVNPQNTPLPRVPLVPSLLNPPAHPGFFFKPTKHFSSSYKIPFLIITRHLGSWHFLMLVLMNTDNNNMINRHPWWWWSPLTIISFLRQSCLGQPHIHCLPALASKCRDYWCSDRPLYGC